jgi:hypothetical protein
VIAGQTIPLYVPLGFLAFWAVLLFVNRRAFRNPRGFLRSISTSRADSRLVRALGGSGDPEVEFERLWRHRWLWPLIVALSLAIIFWMLAISIAQL